MNMYDDGGGGGQYFDGDFLGEGGGGEQYTIGGGGGGEGYTMGGGGEGYTIDGGGDEVEPHGVQFSSPFVVAAGTVVSSSFLDCTTLIGAVTQASTRIQLRIIGTFV